jgi:hypothetical protein
MGYSEDEMAEWLNNVGNTMAGVFHSILPNSHQWWYGTHNLSPEGAHLIRKPDLVLLDMKKYQSLQPDDTIQCINWLHIRSIAEVTRQKSFPDHIPERRSTQNPIYNSFSNLINIL